jgi:hypothetical protein
MTLPSPPQQEPPPAPVGPTVRMDPTVRTRAANAEGAVEAPHAEIELAPDEPPPRGVLDDERL